MKKNIVHFITDLNTGGAEIMLLKVLSAVSLDKYNILVISLIDKGTIGHKIESLGIEVFSLNLSRKCPITFSLLLLPFVLKKFKPNIFHGWMYHANLLLSLISLLYPKVRIIWGIRHSLYDIDKEKFLTKLVIYLSKFFSKKCTNIIFNSSKSLEQHVKYGFSEN
ncbi:glycosyltransferase, partial [Candidatus Thioglobus sp.]